jgi:hypothetical protein
MGVLLASAQHIRDHYLFPTEDLSTPLVMQSNGNWRLKDLTGQNENQTLSGEAQQVDLASTPHPIWIGRMKSFFKEYGFAY